MIGGMGLRVILRSSNSADQRVAMGQADMCNANRHVRFTPKSDIKRRQNGMSALGQ
jgi:hypothetical protein